MLRYRLCAIDLDGTLLDSSGRIPEANREAIRIASERGVRVAIVTGRSLPAARPYIESLAAGTLVVTNSGAIIKESLDGSVVRRRLLPRLLADQILQITDDELEPIVHDGPDGEGYRIVREPARENHYVRRYLRHASPEPDWVETIELRRDPVEVMLVGPLASVRNMEDRIRSELGRDTEFLGFERTEYPERDLALLDILSRHASKAHGLRFLAARLRIPLSETMAIGDNWNDRTMLEAAGLGVVMANASYEMKQLGFSQTASCDEDGVEKALMRFLL